MGGAAAAAEVLADMGGVSADVLASRASRACTTRGSNIGTFASWSCSHSWSALCRMGVSGSIIDQPSSHPSSPFGICMFTFARGRERNMSRHLVDASSDWLLCTEVEMPRTSLGVRDDVLN